MQTYTHTHTYMQQAERINRKGEKKIIHLLLFLVC